MTQHPIVVLAENCSMLPEGHGRTCRYTHCGAPAVIVVRRTHGSGFREWCYCEMHAKLYGLKVAGDEVWRTREPDFSDVLGE